MTRSARCLDPCLRLISATSTRSTRNSLKHLPARGYGQVAYKTRPERSYRQDSENNSRHRREGRSREDEDGDDFGLRGSVGRGGDTSANLADHLNHVFSPLKFPPELAHRILTHASHSSAREGHNAGLSFTGRRVLEAYLNLFLNASSALKPSHNLEEIATHTLNTNLLGQEIGSKWGFGRVLQWKPSVSQRELEGSENPEKAWRRIGLYKVQGDAVAAAIGGIFSQFGGSVAHRVFHTRMLPQLLVNGGLPVMFHKEALAACERLGGPESDLLSKPAVPDRRNTRRSDSVDS